MLSTTARSTVHPKQSCESTALKCPAFYSNEILDCCFHNSQIRTHSDPLQSNLKPPTVNPLLHLWTWLSLIAIYSIRTTRPAHILWYSIKRANNKYFYHTIFSTPLLPRPPQHPALKHHQPMILPQCQRPNFTPIQNNRQNYCSVYLNILYVVKQFSM